MSAADYANARAAARRAGLLGDRGVRELLARPRTGDRLAALADGAWRRAVPAISADAVDAVVRGLAEDVAREAREVLSFLGARPRRRVAALLRLEDAAVLEAILRGLFVHAPRSRIVAGAWPSPGLAPALVAELAALPAPERAPELLAERGSPLAGAAAAAVEASADEPRLVRMAVALQRRVVEDASAEVAGHGEDARIARAVLAGHVDGRNATTLLSVDDPDHAAALLLPGGTHPVEALRAVAAGSMVDRRAAVAAWLAPRPGGARLDPAALADPALASQALARVRHRALQRAARASPFSIAVPLALVADRRVEARRIAVVLLGAEHGLPADVLLDLVEA